MCGRCLRVECDFEAAKMSEELLVKKIEEKLHKVLDSKSA